MTTVIDLDGARLTRVLYLDAFIDPDAVGLTAGEVRSVVWAEPPWADGGQVGAASCAWVVSTGGRHVVVDPSGNIDEILHDPASTAMHQAAYASAFAAAGIPIDAVDTVLL
jgi:sugar lactone lactonase YvrE